MKKIDNRWRRLEKTKKGEGWRIREKRGRLAEWNKRVNI